MAKLRQKVGAEGPRSDPYGYEEITFTPTDGEIEVTLHTGLGDWIEVRLVKTEHRIRSYEKPGVSIDSLWEFWTGMTTKQAERYVERLEYPNKCPTCGSKKRDYGKGYAGEMIIFCANCGRGLWSEDPTPYII